MTLTRTIQSVEFTLDISAPTKGCDGENEWIHFQAEIGKTTLFLGCWVENECAANRLNEMAGIAGGMRQGVWYPNATYAGDKTPYHSGLWDYEDQSSKLLMAVGLDPEDYLLRDEARLLLSSVEREVCKDL